MSNSCVMSAVLSTKSKAKARSWAQSLVLVADEVLGAEFEGVVFLVRRVGDDGDFGAESVGPDDGEVAETAEADDGDFLAGADAGSCEWGPCR